MERSEGCVFFVGFFMFGSGDRKRYSEPTWWGLRGSTRRRFGMETSSAWSLRWWEMYELAFGLIWLIGSGLVIDLWSMGNQLPMDIFMGSFWIVYDLPKVVGPTRSKIFMNNLDRLKVGPLNSLLSPTFIDLYIRDDPKV